MIASPIDDDDAHADIDAELREEIARQPPRGFVHRGGRAMQVARAEQADQPVAQIFALQQDEDRDDEHDAGRLQRTDHRRQETAAPVPAATATARALRRASAGRSATRPGCPRSCSLPARARATGASARATRLPSNSSARPTVTFCTAFDLAFDRHLILRQVAGKLRDLGADQRADGRQHRQRDQHGDDHRRHLPEAASAAASRRTARAESSAARRG